MREHTAEILAYVGSILVSATIISTLMIFASMLTETLIMFVVFIMTVGVLACFAFIFDQLAGVRRWIVEQLTTSRS